MASQKNLPPPLKFFEILPCIFVDFFGGHKEYIKQGNKLILPISLFLSSLSPNPPPKFFSFLIFVKSFPPKGGGERPEYLSL